jgi:hypothetical protein
MSGKTEENNEKSVRKPLRDSNWELPKYRYSATLSLTSAID